MLVITCLLISRISLTTQWSLILGVELAPWNTVPSVFLKLGTRNTTMPLIRPSRVELVTCVQRRRRWTPEQKLEIVKQTNEPRSSVSLVAGAHGLSAAQLFQWRKAYMEGSLNYSSYHPHSALGYFLHRCFERNDRQIKTAGGTELQGQLQVFCGYT